MTIHHGDSTTTATRPFSLIEVLVVASVVGLAVAMLVPALATARERVRQTDCGANLKQIGLAALMYAGDHDGHLMHIGADVFDPNADGYYGQSAGWYYIIGPDDPDFGWWANNKIDSTLIYALIPDTTYDFDEAANREGGDRAPYDSNIQYSQGNDWSLLATENYIDLTGKIWACPGIKDSRENSADSDYTYAGQGKTTGDEHSDINPFGYDVSGNHARNHTNAIYIDGHLGGDR